MKARQSISFWYLWMQNGKPCTFMERSDREGGRIPCHC
jgi:hypothetical protein